MKLEAEIKALAKRAVSQGLTRSSFTQAVEYYFDHYGDECNQNDEEIFDPTDSASRMYENEIAKS